MVGDINMKTEFESNKIEEELKNLLKDGVIKDEGKLNKLKDIYIQDKRSLSEIEKEIKELRFNKNLLDEKLKQEIKIEDININNLQETKENECKISLENVTDFEKDGKNYIKIHYPYPYDKVRIIENRGNQTGKERFESLKEKIAQTSLDAEKNTTLIFEQSLLKDCNEINLKDIRELSIKYEFDKLTDDEKQIVYGTLKSIIMSLPVSDLEKRNLTSKSVDTILNNLEKKVYISPIDNIIVISQINNPSKDEIKSLSIQKKTTMAGDLILDYQLQPLNESGYKYENQNIDTLKDEQLIESNTEYKNQSSDDIDKELGSSIKPKAPWQKKKKNSAAFISVLWFAMFLGMILSILLVSLVKLYIS